ncbi:MAG: 30S ribosomal protein S27e [Candidatus Thorarchaeota archaeon]
MQRARKPSRFLVIKCEKCQNQQIVFSHAKNVVKCRICEEILAEPTGGKVSLKNCSTVNVLS